MRAISAHTGLRCPHGVRVCRRTLTAYACCCSRRATRACSCPQPPATQGEAGGACLRLHAGMRHLPRNARQPWARRPLRAVQRQQRLQRVLPCKLWRNHPAVGGRGGHDYRWHAVGHEVWLVASGQGVAAPRAPARGKTLALWVFTTPQSVPPLPLAATMAPPRCSWQRLASVFCPHGSSRSSTGSHTTC